MESTHLFELQTWNAPSILPRVSLVLSRRRLTPQQMNFAVSNDPDYCTFEFAVLCDQRAADRLSAQLARLVELVHISVRNVAPILHRATESGASAAA